MEVAVSAILTVVGLVLLCLGGNWLVNGGVSIAKKFRISNLVIGMTIVAYGTSTPELDLQYGLDWCKNSGINPKGRLGWANSPDCVYVGGTSSGTGLA